MASPIRLSVRKRRAVPAYRRCSIRPLLELLEDRMAPGDAVVGSALSLALLSGDQPFETPLEPVPALSSRLYQPLQLVGTLRHSPSSVTQAPARSSTIADARPTAIVVSPELDGDLFSLTNVPGRRWGPIRGADAALRHDEALGLGLVASSGTATPFDAGIIRETPFQVQPAAGAQALSPGSGGSLVNFEFGQLPGPIPNSLVPERAGAVEVRDDPVLAQPRPAHWLAGAGFHARPRGPANLPDPGAPGALAVTRAEYNFGDTAFTPTGFTGPVEMIADVHYPTDIASLPGRLPLIVFLHGWHPTCYSGFSSFREWPCAGTHQPIPSYRGYDYMGDVLASNGYIVVSVSANGINARDTTVSDVGMNARAQLIQRHLDQWNTFTTKGADPFGTLFVGKVDMQNIGTMGHSRGGDGVATHYVYNQSLGAPYTINAVFPLAPVNFGRRDINNAAQATFLPYCDGDVFDLQGAHYYDDARYNVPGDLAPKHTFLVMGGNHAFSNTIWTPGGWPAATWDDWLVFTQGGSQNPFCGPSQPGNGRLSAAQQRGATLAYASAFFRTYLGGEYQFYPYLTGDASPPPSAQTDQVYVGYHPPDDLAWRLDVNRLLTSTDLKTNALGSSVTQVDLASYDLCGGNAPQPQHCLPVQTGTNGLQPRQPHTTPSARSNRRGLSQLRLAWDKLTASYENTLPEKAGNVSGYYALQFRASLNWSDSRNPVGKPQDFSVTLTDSAGNTSTTLVSSWSAALFYPPGGTAQIPVPRVVLNTIRIPLAQAFTGIDLTNIRSVRFDFDQRPSGALLMTDLMFADPVA